MLDRYIEAQHSSRPHTGQRRGNISAEQLKEIIDAVRREETDTAKRQWGDAWVLQYWGTLRPRDLAQITPEHFMVLEGGLFVAAQRKAAAGIIEKFGSYRWHNIREPSIWPRIYQLIKSTAPTEPLFPHYNYSTASSYVKAFAESHGWNTPGAPVIDGTHSIRHGAATDIFTQAVRCVLSTGAWESESGARNYTHFGERHTLMRKDALKRAQRPEVVSAEESAQQVSTTMKKLYALIKKHRESQTTKPGEHQPNQN